MNLQQLGQQVKAKYPQYNNLSDEDVANKVIAKYPQYKSKIDTTSPTGTQAPTEEPKKDESSLFKKAVGFGSDVFKGITKPIIQSAVVQPYQAAKRVGGIITGNNTQENEDVNLPYYGTFKVPGSYEEVAGTAAQTVAAGLGPVAGGAAFMGGQAMSENQSLGGVVTSSAEGALLGKAGEVGGKLLGKGLRSAGGFLKEAGAGAESLTASAEKQYGKVLAPTTKLMKQTAAQVTPGLAERKVTAISLNDLLNKAEKGVQGASTQLEEAWNKLPENHQTAVHPIIKSITDAENKLTIEGKSGTVVPEGNKDTFNKLGQLKQELIDIAGDDSTPTRLLREYRQDLDAIIKKAGKGFGLSLNDSSVLSARKTVANSIREQLAKSNPEIAKINNEFTFWKRVQDVVGTTIERKTGQVGGLGAKIAGAAGAAAGFASHGLVGAVEGGIIMKNIEKLATSTAWNTTSAAAKSKLADALASGDGKLINIALEELSKGTGILLEKSGQGISKASSLPGFGAATVQPFNQENNQPQ